MASQSHPGAASGPRKIPTRFLVVGLTLLLLIAIGVFFLLSGDTGDQRTIEDRASQPTGPAATKTSSTGTLEAGGTRLLPIPSGGLEQAVGDKVRGRSVPVQNGSLEQGFWIGNSDAQRVYVAYDGKATAEIGRRVDIEGTVREVPARPGQLRLPTDDTAQVKEQGGYIEATSVKQVGKPINAG
jgi:hypothetical protein